MNQSILMRQLFEKESCTYTYVIADLLTREAAVIDPVLETVDRDLILINELDLNLKYVLDTHVHADHITAAGEMRLRTNAKTGLSCAANADCVDIQLNEKSILQLGQKTIKVISTPGHTNTCLSFLFEGLLFTGDALLIRGCGRTDFQSGNSETLYFSVHNNLYSLPDETIVLPGHDYKGFESSTLAEEKKHNPRLKLTNSLSAFKKIMSELQLDLPKKISESVPANLACGKIAIGSTL